MNTLLSLLFLYMVLRSLAVAQRDAFHWVLHHAIAAGDDTSIAIPDKIDADQFSGMADWAARKLGQRAKISLHTRGTPAPFCGRFYIVGGDGNSCTDIRRALAKFHLSSHGLTPKQKVERAVEKAWAYYLTDSETPVIGEWAGAIISFHGDAANPVFTGRWQAQWSPEDQFRNVHEPWMDEIIEKQYDGKFDLVKFREAIAAVYLHDYDPLKMPECVPDDTSQIPDASKEVSVFSGKYDTVVKAPTDDEPDKGIGDGMESVSSAEQSSSTASRRSRKRRRNGKSFRRGSPKADGERKPSRTDRTSNKLAGDNRQQGDSSTHVPTPNTSGESTTGRKPRTVVRPSQRNQDQRSNAPTNAARGPGRGRGRGRTNRAQRRNPEIITG